MIKKLKQTLSEKILLIFIISLAFIFFGSIITIKNKCMFIKNYDPKKITFDNPKNIAIMNLYCGNVIIELYPKISPNSVKRFKMLVRSGKYNNVAFHRVIKDVLVQSGDLEFGKKDNLNYTYIGTGRSGYGNINSELDGKFDFKVGTVALARTDKKNSEDSQFFILLQDAPLFEGEYTPIGKVIYGLEVLREIKYSDKTEYVLRPDFINNFEMLIN
tara:strand:+ start:1329 stop:1976 length:648 start_codon:yes stop_codon:yes gene_type:complete